MSKYGYERKRVREMFFKVMEGYEDPEGETLAGTMEDIQYLLEACYTLGINPLPELRKMLPLYTWKHRRLKDRDFMRQIISRADFIWRVNWNASDGEIMLVTATGHSRAPTERFQSFFAGMKKVAEESTDRLDFVEAFGGVPVYWELDECSPTEK